MTPLIIAFVALGSAATAQDWKPLFDGSSLTGWRETAFTGRGKVRVEEGQLILGAGGPMTGVTLAKSEFPSQYEVRFEAQRKLGGDFFASLTFPVGTAHLTWVTGGWGGDIVGISSIDGWDASDNETRSYYNFELGRWYSFRLQVTPARIRAWINDEQVVNVAIAGRELSLRRGEIGLSAPFGFASYNTEGRVRKIEWRALRQ
ncbi:MAG: DUF1080 domain-containing protein [Bryobacterales bacterium]|nr:DUF1080 domain-containing protein [Bryobacterales bacterium]